MIVPITLALPCRVLRLDLRVAPLHGVTTLEDLVARGILAGRDPAAERGDAADPDHSDHGTTVSYLTWLLQVPERVVVDVVGTLWGRGHVTVDFDNGEIQLSEEARAKLARRESLAAGGQMQTRDFLFEPVTGIVLPERMGANRPGETSVELPLRQGIREADIPPAELAASVQAALRRDRARTGRLNVLEVGFGSPALRDSAKIRWIEVEVAARRDPENDRISLTVDKTALWSSRAQQRLSAYFDRLTAEEPDHPVVQRITRHAEVKREPSQSLDVVLHRMGTRVADLEDLPINQVTEQHRYLTESASEIRERLADIRRARARVSLIISTEGHDWAIDELVDSARNQLVLVVPDPDVARLRTLLPGLRSAVDRGVQLVFLWGRAPGDLLPEQAGTLLDELQLRSGARVIWDRRSTQTEACLVIQDDCRAIVGSHSQLGRQQPSANEVALLIEPAEDGREVPRAVAELLEWVRDEFPRWRLAQQIERASDESITASVPASATDESADRADADPDPAMTGIRPADVDETALPLWAAGWVEAYEALVEARAKVLAKEPAVEVVRDGEHRALLWQGLREARRRLVITDDRLDPQTANASLARAVRDRRAAGTAVHLIHPGPPRSDRSAEDFAGLGRGPNAASVRIQRRGGRVLVADDRVLIGSFSPLADRYAASVGRRISRLGLHVLHEPLAANLAGLLGVRAAEHPDAEPGVALPKLPRPRSTAPVALPLLLEARSAGERRDFGQSVVVRLRSLDNPFAVLSVWRELGIPDNELRQAVAAVLHAGLGPAADACDWLDWLIEDAWERGAYVEAAILADRRDGLGSTLRTAAVLTSTLETGPFGDLIEDAFFALEDSPVAKTAGAVGVMSEVLVWGDARSAELLGLLSDDLSPAWRELCGRVERFRHVPLPLAYLAAEQTRAETVRSLDRRREGLVTAIDKVEDLRQRFDFSTGLTLHGELFRTGGLLQRIREAAHAGHAQCLDLVPDLPRDVREHLDSVIAEAGHADMEWSRQVPFLHRIEEIVRSVRTIGDASNVLTGGESWKGHLPDCLELGQFVAQRWDTLYAEAELIGRPYELPMLRFLTTLSPLTAWAKEQS